ncbi:MAG: tryptophan--tRNA ligase [Candidatus Bathyarchaeia archaeon]
MAQNDGEMEVTPWKVSGAIDYDKLIRQFGTQPLTDDLLERLKKHAGGLHVQLRRRMFFSHRDLDWLLDVYEVGQRFTLYTGRGPSGPVHLGHVLPWVFTKHLQDVFKTKLYFQMTDDEKYLIHPGMSLQTAVGYADDNALDLIALGFKAKNTRIISNTRHVKALYDIALRVAKHITFSTVKATFGFEDSSNIGIIFFPSLQSAPCFLESAITGENVPCLIPAAIDQDPYWRVTRDVAPKLGYPKPAQIHCRFLPALGKTGKMSASLPDTAIFTTDHPKRARKKVMDAFTGGRPTAEEQRKLGANPDICTIYDYWYFIFEPDEEKLMEIRRQCISGEILCGECKLNLWDRVEKFLIQHQARREKARDQLQDFYLKDSEIPSLKDIART